MARFQFMSYHLNGCRSAAGDPVLESCARVIRSQKPDLVMLQRVGSPLGPGSLQRLADAVPMGAQGPDDEGSCAFLSRYPLHNTRSFSLGHGGCCVRADLDLAQERVHLFNLCLSLNQQQRREQIDFLLSEELLNNPNLPCATIVGGDFSMPLWGFGQGRLVEQLRRSSHPFWRANYPGSFPLWGRDRIYFRGPIRALQGSVIASEEARSASPHLPLQLTIETLDPRCFLHLKAATEIRKQPSPLCG